MAAPTEELGAATGCSDCAEVPACASQSDEQPEQPAEGAPPKAGVKLNRRQRRKLVRAPLGVLDPPIPPPLHLPRGWAPAALHAYSAASASGL